MTLITPKVDWPVDAAGAMAMQRHLAEKVVVRDDFGGIKTIAGVDVSYDVKRNLARAVIAVLDFATLEVVQIKTASLAATFPYIPGLLSFREAPSILHAFERLENKPDLLMVDGQGIAHPRGLGIASHLGVLLDTQAIGVAKSRLTGRFRSPQNVKGSTTPLMAGSKRIGIVLRSKTGCNPLFISPGHRIGFDTALQIVLKCLTSYRLPEPTRIADKISKSDSSFS